MTLWLPPEPPERRRNPLEASGPDREQIEKALNTLFKAMRLDYGQATPYSQETKEAWQQSFDNLERMLLGVNLGREVKC